MLSNDSIKILPWSNRNYPAMLRT